MNQNYNHYNKNTPRKKIIRPINGENTHKFSARRNFSEELVTIGSPIYKNAKHSREKYLVLAKEAYNGGDRVTAEYWYQHVDHYSRVITRAHETATNERKNFEDKNLINKQENSFSQEQTPLNDKIIDNLEKEGMSPSLMKNNDILEKDESFMFPQTNSS